MQKIRPLYRYIIVSASYLLLAAVFFSAGYFLGRSTVAQPVIREAASISIPQPATEEPRQTKYRVILEDGELRLYCDENGMSRMMSAEKISSDSFPSRDIAILREGIVFDSSEAALTLMENFLS